MARRSRIVLGLNSGTSADGVDAVACEIGGRGVAMRVRVLLHCHRAYPSALRERILAAMAPVRTRTEDICRLHAAIGHAFAHTAAAAIRRLGHRVDLVGSHGQTVCHLPPGRRASAGASSGTLQLGDAARIAARIGAPVVSDFRQADMAVGGQGAPLVPWTDWVLFRHARQGRIIQNIGGIANLTWLPAGGRMEDVVAFDTGPGNMVIDALVRHFTDGRECYDRSGRRAAWGKVDTRLSEAMADDRYLRASPPKSCGREQFGEPWVRRLLRRQGRRSITADDWIATATDRAARDIARSYVLHLHPPKGRTLRIDEIILCGGGANNRTLVRRLRDYVRHVWPSARFANTSDHGIPPQAKEGVSFAMLAAARADRVPANLPRVTGANRAVVLGQLCEPP
ncbi:MAG: anhydro-N-acetylmuramic acid kinase [Phycisphaerae bacterium]